MRLTKWWVVRMSCKSVIPPNMGILMLWGKGCNVGGVEIVKKSPNGIHGLQEEDVCVHVQNQFNVRQDILQSNTSYETSTFHFQWIFCVRFISIESFKNMNSDQRQY